MPARAAAAPHAYADPHAAAPHAYFLGETKQIVNGQVIQDSAIKSVYNGKLLHIDERDNNKIKHYTIKNKKIMNKLLANPISNLGLFERLSNDFKIKPRYSIGKHSKHSRSIGKHSRSIGKHSRSIGKHSMHSRSIGKHSRSKHKKSNKQ